jgi:hypothetical protein
MNGAVEFTVLVEECSVEILSKDPGHVLVLVAWPEPFEETDVSATGSDDDGDII